VSCPKSFREEIDFHDLLRQKPPYVYIVMVEFNLSGLSNNVMHVLGFCGEDGGFMKLNAVCLVYAVFSHG
jgi:hypothetical protein